MIIIASNESKAGVFDNHELRFRKTEPYMEATEIKTNLEPNSIEIVVASKQ